MPEAQAWHRDKVVREYLAGCAAGASNVLTGYPFDTVKVHLQTASAGQYRSAFHCVSYIYRLQGVRCCILRGLRLQETSLPRLQVAS